MTIAGWAEILAFCALLVGLSPLLGSYMAKVYTGQRVFLTPLFAWPEGFLLRVFHVDAEREQDWKSYAKSLIIFSLAGWIDWLRRIRERTIQPTSEKMIRLFA